MRDLKIAFRALADTSRLGIVHLLGGCEETTVTDLAAHVRLSQPLISWHLRILRRAGIVQTRRTGRTVYCSLDRDRLFWLQDEISKLANGQTVDEGNYSRGLLLVDQPLEA
ncbi:MAG: metalloregulator ArsR/SmtB family transcription factor [Dehalococcoidia bacterium]|nr:metalloregulator ArsR/SmtB family transcription factor [Dehalococcoidia bacterium]